VDVVPPLIANREPTVLGKPCQRAHHNPPVPPLGCSLLSLHFLAILTLMRRLRSASRHFLVL
jgi:hypothetical protein